jgi:RNA polymerase sigma-70 factor, ECF subfamily
MTPAQRFVEQCAGSFGIDRELGLTLCEQRLSQAVRENPGIGVELGDFAAWLAERVSSEADPLQALADLYVGDLLFAYALSLGDRAAFTRLQRELVPKLSSFVKRDLLPAAGELEQAVLTRLFVAPPGQLPRIRQYSGSGPLAAWLRMSATRVALDLRRADSSLREAPALESPAVATDPELDYLKLRYADDFKLALEGALETLDDRAVTLLELSFIDGLSAGAIAKMYGVSSRTVQRWVAEVRETLLARTRSSLEARLRISQAEVDSLLGLMQSRLHLSLHRVLLSRTRAGTVSDSSPP